MTKRIFKTWIKRFDINMKEQNRKILLIQDNFSGHIIDFQLRNIELYYLPPNMTAVLQPLDAGMIHRFKTHWR